MLILCQEEQFGAEQLALYESRPTVEKPLGESTSANPSAGTLWQTTKLQVQWAGVLLERPSLAQLPENFVYITFNTI